MSKRKPSQDDFDLFGDAPSTSRRKHIAAPLGPAVQGGPSGPAMKGGPSGPAMQGGPSGPAMKGGPSGPAFAGSQKAACKKATASKTRKRSVDDDTFKSLF